DTAGNCRVHFESASGATAIRSLDWSELVVIDQPDRVTLPSDALVNLDQRATDVCAAEQAYAAALALHGVAPGDADLYRRAARTPLDRAAHNLHADPPAWLDTWLGPRPITAAAAAVWDDATTRIAHHRLLHNIPSEEDGIGSHPTDETEAH